MEKFRTLYADEIECRVARCTENGAQLLLYKDARCDMNILDDIIGPENWQRKHEEHKGNLFCAVGIKVGDAWIWKEDAGAESNTEAEKGHASDSFKRACVNWGIGRELYTSPFIWVNVETKEKKGKWTCDDKFTVARIGYDDKRQINALEIVNKAGQTVYRMGQRIDPPKPAPEKPAPKEPVYFKCEECGEILKPYKTEDGTEIGVRRHAARSEKKFNRVLCLDCIKKMEAAE